MSNVHTRVLPKRCSSLKASETARSNVTRVDGYSTVPMISGQLPGLDAVLWETRAPRIPSRAHAMH